MHSSVLIIDDDPLITKGITRFLQNFEFDVIGATSVSDAVIKLTTVNPDIVLLDLSLPDGHGFELAKNIRSNLDVPIIILSGSAEQIDKIVALEIGADDYLSKPFEMRELLARCRAVLRRTVISAQNKNKNSIIVEQNEASFGIWVCNFGRYIVETIDSKNPNLTISEIKLLEALIRANGKVLSRDNLMDFMNGKSWGPMDRSIDVLIGKIRKKMFAVDPAFNYIVTLRGQGYKFIEKVIWK